MNSAISQRTPARITSTGAVKSGAGSTSGFICSTSSSGTVTIYDNTTNSGTVIVNVMPVTSGQWYPVDYKFGKGLYVVIGGAADITFFI